jgi:hypothetical protein
MCKLKVPEEEVATRVTGGSLKRILDGRKDDEDSL